MKISRIVVFAAVALCVSQLFATPPLPFKRGVNTRYLDEMPYSTNPRDKSYIYSLTNTFPEIKAKGFDHVRLSVDVRKNYDSETDAFRTSRRTT